MGKLFVLDLGILPPFGRADTVDLERNISLYNYDCPTSYTIIINNNNIDKFLCMCKDNNM